MSDPDPQSVTCPRCKAKPGARCTTPGGNPTYKEHMARVDAANKPIKTKTGKVLTDSDIEALADEAERGYDVSHLAKPHYAQRPKLPKKLKYKVRARHYAWCDAHGGVHPAQTDYYEEAHVMCEPSNWRRVYIESDDKNEEF